LRRTNPQKVSHRTSNSGNQYRLSLDVLHPTSKYLLRATVRTDGGADSTGQVTVKVVPSDHSITK
jgi:hypothetical protein